MSQDASDHVHATVDDLVLRARTDREAFGLLYDRYHGPVHRYCARRLFVLATAEDVVSDVFLAVASRIRDFPGKTETDFRCWLFRIATNAVNAHLRQARQRRLLLEAAARSHEIGPGEASAPRADDWDVLDWPTVFKSILELDERDQTILMLRFFADCTHDEIASVVEASPGAVRTALSRTLSQLREKFNPEAAGTATSPRRGKE